MCLTAFTFPVAIHLGQLKQAVGSGRKAFSAAPIISFPVRFPVEDKKNKNYKRREREKKKLLPESWDFKWFLSSLFFLFCLDINQQEHALSLCSG